MTKYCPYKGLVPYNERDARYFFGRSRERRLISAALRASRLTVLYGESGAGKSSVLAAGVAHDLRDDADYALVLFRNWRDEPMTGLLNAVRDRLSKLPGFTPNEIGQEPGELLQRWSEAAKRSLLIVLDQFEEYFQYHPAETGRGTLAEELPRLLNQPDLPVNFLVAIRGDALGTLDRFKGAISNLFDNLLRIEHLSRKAAQEAIVEPLRRFNEDLREGRFSASPDHLHPIEIEEEVAADVVNEIVRAQGEDQERVQAPYLQLVMTQWWEREIEEDSRVMREPTLNETLGGVKKVVEGHLKSTIEKLAPVEREAVALLFGELVTSTGRKIAKTVSELAEISPLDRPVLEDLFRRLSDARLLSTVPPPRGAQPGERCYEFSHDVVAKAAYEWRRQFRQAQELAEAKKKEEEACRQATRFRRLSLALGAVLLLAIAAIVFAFWQRATARAREWVTISILSQDECPELSVLAAAHAVAATGLWGHGHLPEAEQQLHRSVAASHVRLTLMGHGGRVARVAWSPDGKRLATASNDGTAKVWDAATGKELRTLSGHSGSVLGVAWSPDAKCLATGSGDGTAKVWDAETGKELLSLSGHTRAVWSVAWSPDGKRLATGSYDKTMKVWDAETGKELLTLRDNISVGGFVSVAWSPDGKRLATSWGKTAKLWDAETGKGLLTLSGHSQDVWSVAWSPDGKRLATGSEDRTAKVWDAETGKELLTLSGHSGGVLGVAWSPDGQGLATGGSDDTAMVWNDYPGEQLLTLIGHIGFVTSVAWSPDGKRLATSSDDGTAKVWDPEPGGEFLTLASHAGFVGDGVAWSPDGKRLATGSEDRTAKLWDAETGKELLTLIGHIGSVESVAWSPDGKRLATASNDGTAKVWDAATGKELLTLSRYSGSVLGVAWSPDGRRLVTDWDKTAKVWDAEKGKELLTLSGHSQPVSSVAWSPDAKRLATGSWDGTAKVWDAETGKELLTLIGRAGVVRSVAWSPDGQRLATGNDDVTAKVWDTTMGKELLALTGHIGRVQSVAWRPDGKRLATGSTDGTVQVYALDIRDLMGLARRRVTAHPEEDGCKKYFHVDKCPPVPELSFW